MVSKMTEFGLGVLNGVCYAHFVVFNFVACWLWYRDTQCVWDWDNKEWVPSENAKTSCEELNFMMRVNDYIQSIGYVCFYFG